MNAIPNILLLNDELMPGGVTRHVLDIAHGLQERNISVVVAATVGPWRERLDSSVPFVPLRLMKSHSFDKDFKGFWNSYRTICNVVRDHNIELIHSHKRYSDALARMIANRMDILHVSTCHNTFANYRLISSFGKTTIACSESVRQILIKKYRKNEQLVKTVYYGIVPMRTLSEAKKRDVRRDFGIAASARVLLSIGHLTPPKDRMTLLKSIVLLRSKLRKGNAILLIVGEGEEKEMLERFIVIERIGDLVRFLPSSTDIESVINSAEFLILSSVQEGLPYVLLEAASLCKPHIATNVGGIPEFVKHGESGFLVEPQDPRQLADAIERLLVNPSITEAFGKNARRRFDQFHRYEHFLDSIVSIYGTMKEMR
jgi:glycosyltransferase involved in cell wall biosynthesis